MKLVTETLIWGDDEFVSLALLADMAKDCPSSSMSESEK